MWKFCEYTSKHEYKSLLLQVKCIYQKKRLNTYLDETIKPLRFHAHTYISNIHSQILSRPMIKINTIVDKLSLCCYYFKWSLKFLFKWSLQPAYLWKALVLLENSEPSPRYQLSTVTKVLDNKPPKTYWIEMITINTCTICRSAGLFCWYNVIITSHFH